MSRRPKKTIRREPSEHFAKLNRLLMETPAWQALSSSAQAAFPWLMLEWKGPQYNNNGKIRLSLRQLAERMGVVADTAGKALGDLQAKGFLVQTERACLGIKGEAKAPAYEITELAMPGIDPKTEKPLRPRKLYAEWREGHDFPVAHTPANNPKGRNGKTKPRPKNHDGPVLEIMMK